MQSRLLTIREQWLLLGVSLAIVFGAGVLIWRGSGDGAASVDTFPVAPETPVGARAPAPSAPAPSISASAETPRPALPSPAARIGVGVMGAVNRPGLYYFKQGDRIQDLLARAGGTLPEAYLSDINRTALLIDETTLLVPRVVSDGRDTYLDPAKPHNPPPYTRSSWYAGMQAAPTTPAAAPGHSAAPPPAASGRININTATQAELESLPGIGPATAVKIIAYRTLQQFQHIEDLQNVSGIGPAKMAAVRDRITVE